MAIARCILKEKLINQYWSDPFLLREMIPIYSSLGASAE